MTDEEALMQFKYCTTFFEEKLTKEYLEAICIAFNALEQKDKVEVSIEQYKADLQADYEAKLQEIYDCGYDCGYSCGYADAMNDISESEG